MTPDPIAFVVDDDAGSRESMCWLIESAGISTLPFESPLYFLGSLDADQPGCLVTDLRMPEMTGLDLVQKLRERKKPIPAIVITAYAEVESCKKALKMGVVDFLEKPVPPEELLERVRDGIVQAGQAWTDHREQEAFAQRLALLTFRELEVAKLLFQGLDMKQIAVTLKVSHQTVARHRTSVFEKLAVSSEAELARLLVRMNGVVRSPSAFS